MKNWLNLTAIGVLFVGIVCGSIYFAPHSDARMNACIYAGSTAAPGGGGTGWTISTDPTELTGWTTDTAWTTADLTSVTSSSARMAIIRATRTDTAYGGFDFGIRPTGSTYTHVQDVKHSHQYVVVSLDSGQQVDYYQEDNTEQNFYLVAWSEADTMFTDPVDKSLGSTATWTDSDLTSDGVAAGATGAFFEIWGDSAATRQGYYREDGITSAPWSGVTQAYIADDEHFFAGVGLATGEVCELYISDVDVDHYLWGYSESSEMVWLDSATDISLTANFASWQDSDLTSYIPSGDPVGAIIMIVNNAGNDCGKVRENGSTDDISAYECYLTASSSIITYVGMDSGDVIEIYANDDTIDHYVIGFIY